MCNRSSQGKTDPVDPEKFSRVFYVSCIMHEAYPLEAATLIFTLTVVLVLSIKTCPDLSLIVNLILCGSLQTA